MTLVSMKTDSDGAVEYKPNPYGYGLTISLSDEQCEALGITSPPAAGTVFNLQARAVASEVTASLEEPGEGVEPGESGDVRMCLQITDMSLSPDAGKSIADSLYGG